MRVSPAAVNEAPVLRLLDELGKRWGIMGRCGVRIARDRL
jgi:hypothetical protein